MIAPGLAVASHTLTAQWEDGRLSWRLKEAVLWGAAWAHQFGGQLVITSIFRTVEEEYALQQHILERAGMAEPERSQCARRLADSSLHPRWRAIDTRIPVIIGADLRDLLAEACERFPYDPQRPKLKTVIRHPGTGDHLHWQARAESQG